MYSLINRKVFNVTFVQFSASRYLNNSAFFAWSTNHAIENQQSMLTVHAYLFVRLCLFLKSLFSRLLSEVVFPVVQEAASRVQSSEEGT